MEVPLKRQQARSASAAFEREAAAPLSELLPPLSSPSLAHTQACHDVLHNLCMMPAGVRVCTALTCVQHVKNKKCLEGIPAVPECEWWKACMLMVCGLPFLAAHLLSVDELVPVEEARGPIANGRVHAVLLP